MKKLLIILVAFINIHSASAQHDIKSVLSDIEKNNTTLHAYQDLINAGKLETHTGIFPDNPEIGFNYLWGNEPAIGNRHDISVMQTFDFPSAYSYKKQIANTQNKQLDLDYSLKRLEILAKAKAICIELTYLNLMNKELQIRFEYASKIATSYNAKFKQGDSNILEKNKASLNLLTAKKELETNNSEREAVLSELTALNGGYQITFTNEIYSIINLPESFEDWYSQSEIMNPVLQQSKNQITINKKEEKLNQALNLPKFSTGYMSESIVGESFKGISLGVSIPLWENKNTIKLARSKKLAAEKAASDKQLQIYNHLKTRYEKAKNLQTILNDYRESLSVINNTELLKKALDEGGISLIDYMLELTLYYETNNKILKMERDLNQTISDLYFFDL